MKGKKHSRGKRKVPQTDLSILYLLSEREKAISPKKFFSFVITPTIKVLKETKHWTPKSFISILLAISILLTAPGFECYQALGSALEASGPKETALNVQALCFVPRSIATARLELAFQSLGTLSPAPVWSNETKSAVADFLERHAWAENPAGCADVHAIVTDKEVQVSRGSFLFSGRLAATDIRGKTETALIVKAYIKKKDGYIPVANFLDEQYFGSGEMVRHRIRPGLGAKAVHDVIATSFKRHPVAKIWKETGEETKANYTAYEEPDFATLYAKKFEEIPVLREVTDIGKSAVLGTVGLVHHGAGGATAAAGALAGYFGEKDLSKRLKAVSDGAHAAGYATWADVGISGLTKTEDSRERALLAAGEYLDPAEVDGLAIETHKSGIKWIGPRKYYAMVFGDRGIKTLEALTAGIHGEWSSEHAASEYFKYAEKAKGAAKYAWMGAGVLTATGRMLLESAPLMLAMPAVETGAAAAAARGVHLAEGSARAAMAAARGVHVAFKTGVLSTMVGIPMALEGAATVTSAKEYLKNPENPYAVSALYQHIGGLATSMIGLPAFAKVYGKASAAIERKVGGFAKAAPVAASKEVLALDEAGSRLARAVDERAGGTTGTGEVARAINHYNEQLKALFDSGKVNNGEGRVIEKLTPGQQELYDMAMNEIANAKSSEDVHRLYLKLATGGGKTVLAGGALYPVVSAMAGLRGAEKIIYSAPTPELNLQARNEMAAFRGGALPSDLEFATHAELISRANLEKSGRAGAATPLEKSALLLDEADAPFTEPAISHGKPSGTIPKTYADKTGKIAENPVYTLLRSMRDRTEMLSSSLRGAKRRSNPINEIASAPSEPRNDGGIGLNRGLELEAGRFAERFKAVARDSSLPKEIRSGAEHYAKNPNALKEIKNFSEAFLSLDSLGGRYRVDNKAGRIIPKTESGTWSETLDIPARRYLELKHNLDVTKPYEHKSVSNMADVLERAKVVMAFSGTKPQAIEGTLKRLGFKELGKPTPAQEAPIDFAATASAKYANLARAVRENARNPQSLSIVAAKNTRDIRVLRRLLSPSLKPAEIAVWASGKYELKNNPKAAASFNIEALKRGTARVLLLEAPVAGRGIDLPGQALYKKVSMFILDPHELPQVFYAQIMGRILGNRFPNADKEFKLFADAQTAGRNPYLMAEAKKMGFESVTEEVLKANMEKVQLAAEEKAVASSAVNIMAKPSAKAALKTAFAPLLTPRRLIPIAVGVALSLVVAPSIAMAAVSALGVAGAGVTLASHAIQLGLPIAGAALTRGIVSLMGRESAASVIASETKQSQAVTNTSNNSKIASPKARNDEKQQEPRNLALTAILAAVPFLLGMAAPGGGEGMGGFAALAGLGLGALGMAFWRRSPKPAEVSYAEWEEKALDILSKGAYPATIAQAAQKLDVSGIRRLMNKLIQVTFNPASSNVLIGPDFDLHGERISRLSRIMLELYTDKKYGWGDRPHEQEIFRDLFQAIYAKREIRMTEESWKSMSDAVLAGHAHNNYSAGLYEAYWLPRINIVMTLARQPSLAKNLPGLDSFLIGFIKSVRALRQNVNRLNEPLKTRINNIIKTPSKSVVSDSTLLNLICFLESHMSANPEFFGGPWAEELKTELLDIATHPEIEATVRTQARMLMERLETLDTSPRNTALAPTTEKAAAPPAPAAQTTTALVAANRNHQATLDYLVMIANEHNEKLTAINKRWDKIFYAAMAVTIGTIFVSIPAVFAVGLASLLFVLAGHKKQSSSIKKALAEDQALTENPHFIEALEEIERESPENLKARFAELERRMSAGELPAALPPAQQRIHVEGSAGVTIDIDAQELEADANEVVLSRPPQTERGRNGQRGFALVGSLLAALGLTTGLIGLALFVLGMMVPGGGGVAAAGALIFGGAAALGSLTVGFKWLRSKYRSLPAPQKNPEYTTSPSPSLRATGEAISKKGSPLYEIATDPVGPRNEKSVEVLTGYPASVFDALTREQKAAFEKRYLDYLRRRDGEQPDWSNPLAPVLSKRETFFRNLEANPIVRRGAPIVNQADFTRHENNHRPEKGLDQAMLWALAMAKVNRSERYGVEYALGRADSSNYGPNDILGRINAQEFYHTRILRDALKVTGIEMQMLPPHPVTAFLVRLLVLLPKPIANILIFCGEVGGVAAFRLLRDKARELFKDQPESLARIEELIGQILVDEVGHVHYVRSQLGPVRLKIARWILPAFSRYLASDMPELEMLFGRKQFMHAITQADVEGAAAQYPDRLTFEGSAPGDSVIASEAKQSPTGINMSSGFEIASPGARNDGKKEDFRSNPRHSWAIDFVPNGFDAYKQTRPPKVDPGNIRFSQNNERGELPAQSHGPAHYKTIIAEHPIIGSLNFSENLGMESAVEEINKTRDYLAVESLLHLDTFEMDGLIKRDILTRSHWSKRWVSYWTWALRLHGPRRMDFLDDHRPYKSGTPEPPHPTLSPNSPKPKKNDLPFVPSGFSLLAALGGGLLFLAPNTAHAAVGSIASGNASWLVLGGLGLGVLGMALAWNFLQRLGRWLANKIRSPDDVLQTLTQDTDPVTQHAALKNLKSRKRRSVFNFFGLPALLAVAPILLGMAPAAGDGGLLTVFFAGSLILAVSVIYGLSRPGSLKGPGLIFDPITKDLFWNDGIGTIVKLTEIQSNPEGTKFVALYPDGETSILLTDKAVQMMFGKFIGFSPDGSKMMTMMNPTSHYIADAVTGKGFYSISSIEVPVFSPDGKQIAVNLGLNPFKNEFNLSFMNAEDVKKAGPIINLPHAKDQLWWPRNEAKVIVKTKGGTWHIFDLLSGKEIYKARKKPLLPDEAWQEGGLVHTPGHSKKALLKLISSISKGLPGLAIKEGVVETTGPNLTNLSNFIAGPATVEKKKERETINVPLSRWSEYVEIGRYKLPYILPQLKTKATVVNESPIVAWVRADDEKPNEKKDILEKFEVFDALIAANFAALGLMASASQMGLTKKTAQAILEKAADMTRAYVKLSGKIKAWHTFEALQTELKALWLGLSGEDTLAPETAKKVTQLQACQNLSQVETIHSLINYLHIRSFAELGRAAINSKAHGNINIGPGTSLMYTNLDTEPLARGDRIRNGMLNKILPALYNTANPARGNLIIKGDQIWFHSSLGSHTMEIYLKTADPDEGGAVEVRYAEGGMDEGNQSRLVYVETVLKELGFHTEIHGGMYLNAALDKDHGLNGKAQIENTVPKFLRSLYYTGNMDWGLQAAGKAYGLERAKEIAADMGRIYLAEGYLPFYVRGGQDLSLVQGYEKYLKNRNDNQEVTIKKGSLFGKKIDLRDVLNAELDRLGLPAIPGNILFGQAVIDEFFTRPVEEGLARGEFNGISKLKEPIRLHAYQPVSDLAYYALREYNEMLLMGASLRQAENEFSFVPVGSVGRLRAERAQIKFPDSQWLTVYGLRDPETGRLYYARAQTYDPAMEKHETLDFKTLDLLMRQKGLLNFGNSLLSLSPELPGRRETDLVREQLKAAPQIETLRDTARGLAASPGRGGPLRGQATFVKGISAGHKVLIAAYTTPDDLETMTMADAVITTGGGLLSHAGITTREMGKPAVILPQAQWKKEASGKSYLEISLLSPSAPRQNQTGLWIGEKIETKTIEIHEGDWVWVDGTEGLVALGDGRELLEKRPGAGSSIITNARRRGLKAAEISGIERNLTAGKKAELAKAAPALLPLGLVDDDYVELVGGKAAKLGAILGVVRKMGGSVPEGIVLTTQAFLEYLDSSGKMPEFEKLSTDLDAIVSMPDSTLKTKRLESQTRLMRDLFGFQRDRPVSYFYQQVLRGIQAHGLGGGPLAVRSSAVQEDTQEAAFAGAAETHLYVHPEDLYEKILATWGSFWLTRSVMYRQGRGIKEGDVRPAVLIQKMANPQSAGVVFTVNPVTGTDEIVINAAFGLGEGIVSGRVQADQFVVKKSNGELARLPLIATKKIKIGPAPSAAGTAEIRVARNDQTKASLDEFQIRKLAEMAKALEDYFGYPLDIEFAIEEGKIIILQARPVTAQLKSEDEVSVGPAARRTQKKQRGFALLGSMVAAGVLGLSATLASPMIFGNPSLFWPVLIALGLFALGTVITKSELTGWEHFLTKNPWSPQLRLAGEYYDGSTLWQLEIEVASFAQDIWRFKETLERTFPKYRQPVDSSSPGSIISFLLPPFDELKTKTRANTGYELLLVNDIPTLQEELEYLRNKQYPVTSVVTLINRWPGLMLRQANQVAQGIRILNELFDHLNLKELDRPTSILRAIHNALYAPGANFAYEFTRAVYTELRPILKMTPLEQRQLAKWVHSKGEFGRELAKLLGYNPIGSSPTYDNAPVQPGREVPADAANPSALLRESSRPINEEWMEEDNAFEMDVYSWNFRWEAIPANFAADLQERRARRDDLALAEAFFKSLPGGFLGDEDLSYYYYADGSRSRMALYRDQRAFSKEEKEKLEQILSSENPQAQALASGLKARGLTIKYGSDRNAYKGKGAIVWLEIPKQANPTGPDPAGEIQNPRPLLPVIASPPKAGVAIPGALEIASPVARNDKPGEIPQEIAPPIAPLAKKKGMPLDPDVIEGLKKPSGDRGMALLGTLAAVAVTASVVPFAAVLSEAAGRPWGMGLMALMLGLGAVIGAIVRLSDGSPTPQRIANFRGAVVVVKTEIAVDRLAEALQTIKNDLETWPNHHEFLSVVDDFQFRDRLDLLIHGAWAITDRKEEIQKMAVELFEQFEAVLPYRELEARFTQETRRQEERAREENERQGERVREARIREAREKFSSWQENFLGARKKREILLTLEKLNAIVTDWNFGNPMGWGVAKQMISARAMRKLKRLAEAKTPFLSLSKSEAKIKELAQKYYTLLAGTSAASTALAPVNPHPTLSRTLILPEEQGRDSASVAQTALVRLSDFTGGTQTRQVQLWQEAQKFVSDVYEANEWRRETLIVGAVTGLASIVTISAASIFWIFAPLGLFGFILGAGLMAISPKMMSLSPLWNGMKALHELDPANYRRLLYAVLDKELTKYEDDTGDLVLAMLKQWEEQAGDLPLEETVSVLTALMEKYPAAKKMRKKIVKALAKLGADPIEPYDPEKDDPYLQAAIHEVESDRQPSQMTAEELKAAIDRLHERQHAVNPLLLASPLEGEAAPGAGEGSVSNSGGTILNSGLDSRFRGNDDGENGERGMALLGSMIVAGLAGLGSMVLVKGGLGFGGLILAAGAAALVAGMALLGRGNGEKNHAVFALRFFFTPTQKGDGPFEKEVLGPVGAQALGYDAHQGFLVSVPQDKVEDFLSRLKSRGRGAVAVSKETLQKRETIKMDLPTLRYWVYQAENQGKKEISLVQARSISVIPAQAGIQDSLGQQRAWMPDQVRHDGFSSRTYIKLPTRLYEDLTDGHDIEPMLTFDNNNEAVHLKHLGYSLDGYSILSIVTGQPEEALASTRENAQARGVAEKDIAQITLESGRIFKTEIPLGPQIMMKVKNETIIASQLAHLILNFEDKRDSILLSVDEFKEISIPKPRRAWLQWLDPAGTASSIAALGATLLAPLLMGMAPTGGGSGLGLLLFLGLGAVGLGIALFENWPVRFPRTFDKSDGYFNAAPGAGAVPKDHEPFVAVKNPHTFADNARLKEGTPFHGRSVWDYSIPLNQDIKLVYAQNAPMAAWTDGKALWVANLRNGDILVDGGIKTDQTIQEIAFSPDGGKLAFAINDTSVNKTQIHIVSFEERTFCWLTTIRGGFTKGLAYDDKGKILAAVTTVDGYDKVTLWDVERGALDRISLPAKAAPANAIKHWKGESFILTGDGDKADIMVLEPTFTSDQAWLKAWKKPRGKIEPAIVMPIPAIQKIFISDRDGRLYVADLFSNQIKIMKEPKDDTRRLMALGYRTDQGNYMWLKEQEAYQLNDSAFGASDHPIAQVRFIDPEHRLDHAGQFIALQPEGKSLAFVREGTLHIVQWEGYGIAAVPPVEKPTAQPVQEAPPSWQVQREEIAGRMDIFDIRAVVARLAAWRQGNTLDIIRRAAQKWLVELAALGDPEAIGAIGGKPAPGNKDFWGYEDKPLAQAVQSAPNNLWGYPSEKPTQDPSKPLDPDYLRSFR